jgi:Domain of unknown function (DUF222)
MFIGFRVDRDVEQVYVYPMSTVLEQLDETTVSLSEFADIWTAYEQVGARLSLAVGRFETSGEYGLDGSVSMAAWLRSHCRMSGTDASQLVRRGRFLHSYPHVAAAAVDSTLSAGQVHAMRSNVNPGTAHIFAEQEEAMVAIIAPLDVRTSEQACAAWRQRAEALIDQVEPSVPERKLSCSRSADGSLVGGFVFDPALAAEFEKALGIALTWEGRDDTRTTSVRQADALFDIVSFFNANHAGEGTPRHRAHVELGIDAESLHDTDCCATTVDGNPVPASSADAFLCDAIIQRFTMNGSVPIDIGRATRTVPVHMFRAVAQRDGGCRHPGCDRKIAWCDAHHIHYWRRGGHTRLDNLVLLCARHHHLIHRPGWQLKLLPDATIEITTPDGQTLTSEPRPRPGQRLKHLKPRT